MKKSLSLEYNSTRDKLQFSEYGRSVQKLIQYAKSIESKAERQRVVEEIVELINQLNPQTKNVLEYKQKLWRHVFQMADYELDVDHPYGEHPTAEDNRFRPDKVPYPQHEFNWRHYGYNIRVMIDKALKMEDGPVKQGYTETILSYMKLSYRTWNKEHFVSDDIIISDLSVMSGNKLSVDDDHTIQVVTKNNLPNSNVNTFKTPRYKGKPSNNQPNKNQVNKNRPPSNQNRNKPK
ncbi:MAG: DUF4290 domain-containing protein [Saprospiraceae bacterium]|nr:DUF4290 domain-containing protein [Saprospiraceae bacterium]MBK8668465.1 DUF4290 domain-containing protein [Saprospiraceae bacterium]MBL0098792.1 DUF4290 domain-containing protein [Saprospiraceae bacterium]